MVKAKKKPQSKKESFVRCAELFKVMSSSKRLEIMNIIKDKEVTVNEISKSLGLRKSNTSQHLAYLRYVGIVGARRSGKNIFYKLVDPKIMDSCKILNEVKIKNLLV
jgi:ArsR family transcriptional regulator